MGALSHCVLHSLFLVTSRWCFSIALHSNPYVLKIYPLGLYISLVVSSNSLSNNEVSFTWEKKKKSEVTIDSAKYICSNCKPFLLDVVNWKFVF